MRRKQSWSPYAVAGIRDSLARPYRDRVQDAGSTLDYFTQQGYDEATDQLRAGLLENLRDAERAASAVHDAELFWVATDMADIALDASQDIPTLDGQDMHWPVGLMVFETPLPAHSLPGSRSREEPHPVDGMMWFSVENGLRVETLVKRERMPEALRPPHGVLVPNSVIEVPLPADFADDSSFPNGLEGEMFAQDLGVAAFLGAAWHLMAMPAVARSRDVQPRTGESRAAESVTVPVGQVRVVDARPMRTVPADPEETAGSEDSGRRYSTRWVVRGHWRQQAHGTGRAQRRTQWIESYIKGPEDAPLAPHTLVRAWRR
jgi:hypothetical protein